MYKYRSYGGGDEVLFIDGKFSAARLLKFKPNGQWEGQPLYYMHEGVMYHTPDESPTLFKPVLTQFMKGEIESLAEVYGTISTPCSTFLEDFRKMRKKNTCMTVTVGNKDVELVHYKRHGYIHVNSLSCGGKEHMGYCFKEGFQYCSTSAHDLQFRGYPDMDDTSVQMNVLMMSASVERMRAIGDFFKEYTKLMDIKY